VLHFVTIRLTHRAVIYRKRRENGRNVYRIFLDRGSYLCARFSLKTKIPKTFTELSPIKPGVSIVSFVQLFAECHISVFSVLPTETVLADHAAEMIVTDEYVAFRAENSRLFYRFFRF